MDRFNTPPAGKFSFLWSNSPDGSEKMLNKVLRLPAGTLTCKQLFVDRITIVQKPTEAILKFDSPDHPNATWRAETYNLFIRLNGTEGLNHPVYVFRAGASTQQYPSQISNYGQSFIIDSDVEGDHDRWCVMYKPVRDQPIAVNLKQTESFDISMFFPLHGMNMPDYRVDSMLVEFSYQN